MQGVTKQQMFSVKIKGTGEQKVVQDNVFQTWLLIKII
jgi:hypothetical protein